MIWKLYLQQRILFHQFLRKLLSSLQNLLKKATQSDLNNEEERVKYVSNWEKHLIEARKYTNERDVHSRIVLTSAKMEFFKCRSKE